ncbi:MAG: nuclear transport factor 2 family protein [Proteobacteria bacterium]|nr:nuclear transport factor 2 family protein [Pseudomonadota bacterium]HQR03334.1 nuclear transport factor 2 family protein [Rhodocyclaceae bacterium]
MSPQEIADRFAIQDLLVRYCYAIDDRDWKAFARLFTDDAVLDYSAFGAPCGSAAEMAAYLQGRLPQFAGCQHTISTLLVDIKGDTAFTRTAGLVPILFPTATDEPQVSFSGLWYHDTLVRTADGWRFQKRVQVRSWVHNMPQLDN